MIQEAASMLKASSGLSLVAAICALAACTQPSPETPESDWVQGGPGAQPPANGAGGAAGVAPGATATSGAGASGTSGSTATAGAGATAGGGGATTGAGAGGAIAQAGVGGSTVTPMTTAGAGGAAATCDKDLTPLPGQDACAAPLKPGDDRLCMQMIGGQLRTFYVYASPAFNPCEPATLIMDCHGLSESIEVHTGKEGFNLTGQQYPKGYGSGWRMAVQRDNAIVVTPAGIGESWTVSTDVPFVNAVADFVLTTAEVNPDHVYVTGISMGGMMTVATGCDDAARWRGMAPVAMLGQGCAALARPTPVISFHATGDALTSYAADQALMQQIAGFNHCMVGPTPSASYGGANSSPDPVCYVTPNGVGDPDAPDPLNVPLQACPASAPPTDCVTWSQCDEGVEVTFCTVSGASQPLGGHILYNNDTQLNLAEVAWPFFKKFWK